MASPATGCWKASAPTPSTGRRTAGELTTLRNAHAAWWADWLEPLGAMPTDDILEEMEAFHANLVAALDWSADEPALGLRLLRDVAIAWEDLGRAGDAMAAADRLLTDDNAQRYSAEWLAAAWRTSFLYFSARGPAEAMPFLERIEAVAAQQGDEFYRRLARWPKEPCVTDAAWRDLAREQADRHLQAWVPIYLAWTWPKTTRLPPHQSWPRPMLSRRRAACAPCAISRATPGPNWHARPAISPLPSSSRGTSCRVRGRRGGATPSAV